ARPLRRERLQSQFSLRQPEGRHVRGVGVPARCRGQRGRGRAGLHGRRGRRLRERGALQHLRHELRGGVQRSLQERRRVLQRRVSRGLAVGDLDNDGRLDVVTNDLDGSPQVLRNEYKDAGHWLLVKLRGDRKNRDAVGAIVTAKVGTLTQSRLVRSGTSYLSQ